MDTDLEESLIKAAELVSKEGGAPENVFHPDYGCILIDGKPTDAGLRWYKENYESR
jgi:hypothetical protein